MKKTFTFIFLTLIMLSGLKAQWISPGNGTNYQMQDLTSITNGLVVQVSENTFAILGDLTISANDQLTINAGETIQVENEKIITVEGTMLCNGTADQLVEFTGDNNYGSGTPVGYFDLRFEDAMNNNIQYTHFYHCGGIVVIESPISFIHCEFDSFNKQNSSAAVNYHNGSPIFEYCYFHDNEGSAISSGANIMGSPKILNCTFYNNVTANTNTPQINIGPGAEDTVYIVGNHIEGVDGTMVGGFAIADLVNVGATKVSFCNNVVINNRYGYTQMGYNVDALICDNIFKDNNLETDPMNGGSGISIYGSTTGCAATLRRNLITGNLWGITAIYYHNIDMGTEEEWGENVIYGNGNGGTLYELYDNGFNDITAIGNYWGSSDEEYAESVIFHQVDQSNLGLVTFSPILQLHPVITSFAFLAEENSALHQDYFGEINEVNHTINVMISEDIDLSNLVPRYEIPLGTSGNPASGTSLDFSSPLSIFVTTPHDENQEWIINVSKNVGIVSNNIQKLTAFPNPVSGDSFHLDVAKSSEINIYNALGQLMLSQNVFEGTQDINVKGWPKGIYYLSSSDAHDIDSIKIIVK